MEQASRRTTTVNQSYTNNTNISITISIYKPASSLSNSKVRPDTVTVTLTLQLTLTISETSLECLDRGNKSGLIFHVLLFHLKIVFSYDP